MPYVTEVKCSNSVYFSTLMPVYWNTYSTDLGVKTGYELIKLQSLVICIIP